MPSSHVALVRLQHVARAQRRLRDAQGALGLEPRFGALHLGARLGERWIVREHLFAQPRHVGQRRHGGEVADDLDVGRERRADRRAQRRDRLRDAQPRRRRGVGRDRSLGLGARQFQTGRLADVDPHLDAATDVLEQLLGLGRHLDLGPPAQDVVEGLLDRRTHREPGFGERELAALEAGLGGADARVAHRRQIDRLVEAERRDRARAVHWDCRGGPGARRRRRCPDWETRARCECRPVPLPSAPRPRAVAGSIRPRAQARDRA